MENNTEPTESINPFEGVSLKKKWDCPTDESYNLMLSALKAGKGNTVADMPKWQKKDILDKFAIKVVDGVEIIVGKNSNKRVLKQSEVLTVLQRHHDEAGHPGRITVLKVIQDNYHSVPRPVVERYIKSCNSCAKRKSIPRPPVGKPIRAKGIMSRAQVDLIDVRSIRDGEVKYVMQVKDHFSKFIWLFALPKKEAVQVANCLRKIFYQFAPCRILQADNGGEFTGSAVKKDLLAEFPVVKMVHGRPRHPQSQGLVERANQTLENRLAALIDQNGHEGWSQSLDKLAYEINRSYCRVIKATPFEVMFSRKARDPVEPEIEEITEEWVDIDGSVGGEDDDAEILAQHESDHPDLDQRGEGLSHQANEAQAGNLLQPPSVTDETILHTALDAPVPYLLFNVNPTKAVAIAYRKMLSSVHNSPLKGHEACFEIREVVTEEPPMGKFDEPMMRGAFVKWPKQHATNELGCSPETIKSKIDTFEQYGLDREKQAARYQQKRHQMPAVEVGDVVAMKVPRVDRANVDPQNLAAKVVDNNNGYLSLQVGSSVVETRVHVDKVAPWPSTNPPYFPPLDNSSTSLIGAFRLRAAPHSISVVRSSPTGHVISLQRGPNIIEFRNVTNGVVDKDSYCQSCKGKNAEIIGMEWVGTNEVVFISDSSLELFQVIPDRKIVKSLKVHNVGVKWYKYSAECQILLIAAGTLGNVMYPFWIKGASLTKFPKFEVELFANPSRQSIRILEQDVALAVLYGDTHIMVLRHNPRPNSKGADILLYRFSRETNIEPKLMGILTLGATGRFAVHHVDNLVVVHEQTRKQSTIFDIATVGHLGEDVNCMVHEPVFSDLSIAPPTPNPGPGVGGTLTPNQQQSTNQPSWLDNFEMYAETWSLFQPGVIVDSTHGLILNLTLNLEPCSDWLSDDPVRLVEFLLHRKDGKGHLLAVLKDRIGQKSIRLDQLNLVFGRLNGIYQCYMANRSSPPVPGANVDEVFAHCLVLDQTTMYSRVFFPLCDTEGCDTTFLVEVIMDYILSLQLKGLSVQEFLYDLLVSCLTKCGQYQRLLQLLQYHVLPESKPLAFLLLSLEGQYPPMLHLAIDMLMRLGASEEVVEVLLSKGKVVQALRHAMLSGCIDNIDPLKFCESAFQLMERKPFVFRHAMLSGCIDNIDPLKFCESAFQLMERKPFVFRHAMLSGCIDNIDPLKFCESAFQLMERKPFVFRHAMLSGCIETIDPLKFCESAFQLMERKPFVFRHAMLSGCIDNIDPLKFCESAFQLMERKPFVFRHAMLSGCIDNIDPLKFCESAFQLMERKPFVFRHAMLSGCIDNIDPLKFCESAFQLMERKPFYTVFHFFQQRSLKFRGTPTFAKGDQYDKYNELFKDLYGAGELQMQSLLNGSSDSSMDVST